MKGGGGAEQSRRNRLPRALRLARGHEIRAVLRRGKRSRMDHLDVYHSASPVAHPRIGTVVPLHRRRAVDRNLLKRRLREVLRQDILPRLQARDVAVDVVVRARHRAYEARFAELKEELLEWLEHRL